MSTAFPSHVSFLLWVLLALALLLGLGGDLTAATTVEGGPSGMPIFAAHVTRTPLIQVTACAMALALFIIMRSCKN